MEAPGRYVYCIIPDTGKRDWDIAGVDGRPVYTIPYQDIAALVHDCPLEPYQGDDATVKDWVWTHSQVVDAAWAAAGSVLPMTFDCIIRPAGEHSVEETILAWLRAEYDGFKARLEEFRAKVELGVQIFCSMSALSEAIVESNETIQKLRAEMAGKPKGMAYFYQQKLEKALKKELETKADEDYRRYYRQITAHAEDVRVNKVKRPADGKQMLLNLSLLVRRDHMQGLGEDLERIQAEPGIELRYTGPWPPYSFVSNAGVEREPAAGG